MKVIDNNNFGAKTIKQLIMSIDEQPSSIIKAMYSQSLDNLVRMLNASGVIDTPIGSIKQALLRRHRVKIDQIIAQEQDLLGRKRNACDLTDKNLTANQYFQHLDGAYISFKKRIHSNLSRKEKISAVNALRDDLTKMIHIQYDADKSTRNLISNRFMVIDAAITKWLLLNKAYTSVNENMA